MPLSQLYYGPVVTYCMVYHYTKRATLARLLANEGPAIYVVLEKERSSLMHISQHLYLSFIPEHVLSAYAIFDKCIPILSTEIRKGNSSGKVIES